MEEQAPLVDFVQEMTGLVADYILEIRITPSIFSVTYADLVDGVPVEVHTTDWELDENMELV